VWRFGPNHITIWRSIQEKKGSSSDLELQTSSATKDSRDGVLSRARSYQPRARTRVTYGSRQPIKKDDDIIAEKEAKDQVPTKKNFMWELISCRTAGGSKEYYIQVKEKNSRSKEILSDSPLRICHPTQIPSALTTFMYRPRSPLWIQHIWGLARWESFTIDCVLFIDYVIYIDCVRCTTYFHVDSVTPDQKAKCSFPEC
jgi:hypothetical protein